MQNRLLDAFPKLSVSLALLGLIIVPQVTIAMEYKCELSDRSTVTVRIEPPHPERQFLGVLAGKDGIVTDVLSAHQVRTLEVEHYGYLPNRTDRMSGAATKVGSVEAGESLHGFAITSAQAVVSFSLDVWAIPANIRYYRGALYSGECQLEGSP